MSILFGRSVAVTLWRTEVPKDATKFITKPLGAGEQLEVSQLRVKFKIERDFSKHPNTADIEIFNLAPDSRSDLETKPLRVQLLAGYDGINRLLTIGDVTFAMSKLDGTEWVTLIQVADSGRTYGFSRVNKSYKPGTTYRTILKDCARSMGLTLPTALDKNRALDKQFATGAVSIGPARDELTRLLAPFGYDWSIQNGALRVLADNQAIARQEPLEISATTGMIGTPEFGSPPKSGKTPDINVKMLLRPELVPGDLIQLNSIAKKGKFKVQKVTHTGDTHAGDWTTEIEIKAI